jgi:hypothetical protein
MIIWSGMGGIVIVIAAITLVLTELSVRFVFRDENYYQAHGWPKLLALWAAGLLTWLLSRYLNQKQARVLIDKETGEEVVLKPKHSLFFIRLEYWVYIFFALGIVFFFDREGPR